MNALMSFLVRFVVVPFIVAIITRGCTQLEERTAAQRQLVIFQRNAGEQLRQTETTWLQKLRAKRCDGGGEQRPAFPAPDAGAPAAVGAAAPSNVGAPLTFKLEAGL